MSMFAQLIVACLVTTSPTPSAEVSQPGVTQPAATDVVQVAGESFVKLRKIHLVRPDLIAYPLVIDFIC